MPGSARRSRCSAACLAGHVAVYACHMDHAAHFGELSATSLLTRGVAGCVIDGGCRDTRFIDETGYPVFTRFVTPEDCTWRWQVTATQVPITIGRVRIEPGDWIVGDEDGVVVVPQAVAADVLAAAEAKAEHGERDPRRRPRRDDAPRGIRALRHVLTRQGVEGACEAGARRPARTVRSQAADRLEHGLDQPAGGEHVLARQQRGHPRRYPLRSPRGSHGAGGRSSRTARRAPPGRSRPARR